MNKLIIPILFLSLLAISLVNVSAFSLEKHLVQIEQDENYPCYIEAGETIVCPSIDDSKINDWKDKITNLKDEDKDKGKLNDVQKKQYLSSKIIPYEGKTTKVIDITREYREKVNLNSLKDDETIRIGFATNVFGVSSTPLENFDVNSTTGLIRYRPLNMTWLSFDGINDYVSFYTGSSSLTMNRNQTISFWVNISSSVINMSLVSLAAGCPFEISLFNSTFIRASSKNSSIYHQEVNMSLNSEINDSLWHFLSFSINMQYINYSLYYDGVSASQNYSELMSGAATSCSGNSFVGYGISGFWGNLKYLNGSIDNFRYTYNASNIVSLSQLNSMYISGRIRNDSWNNNNTFYYPFNEKSGSIIYNLGKDTTTFSLFNGTITGATWQSDNINVTTLGYEVNISIVNITSAYIYWDNGTVWNNSLTGSGGNFTGNATFTFLDNQTIYILEGFAQGTSGFTWNGQGNFTNGSNYLVYNNSFSIARDLNLTGMTKALLFYANNTLINSSETGDRLLSVNPSIQVNILDNFNLTEGVTRENSPIWFSYSSGRIRHIANNVSTINVPIIIDLGDCTTKNRIIYTTDSGIKTEFTGQSAKDLCDELKTTGHTFSIEQASSSNVLDWEDGTTSMATTVLKIVMGLLALLVLAIAVGGFFLYVYKSRGLSFVSNLDGFDVIKYGVAILIAIILTGALVNYIGGLV